MSVFSSSSKKRKVSRKKSWVNFSSWQMPLEILKYLNTAGYFKEAVGDMIPSREVKAKQLYGRFWWDKSRKIFYLGFNLVIGRKTTDPNLYNLIKWKKVLSFQLQSPRYSVWEMALTVKHKNVKFLDLEKLAIENMSTNGGEFNPMLKLRKVLFNGFDSGKRNFNLVNNELKEAWYGDEFFKQINKHPNLETIAIINRRYRGNGWGTYKKLKKLSIFMCINIGFSVLVQHQMTLVYLMLEDNTMTNINFKAFKLEIFPKLKTIYITNPDHQIEDSFLQYEGRLPSLESLNLDQTLNTNTPLKFSKSIYNTLRNLEIDVVPSFSDQIFKTEIFKKLTRLSLSTISITGEGWTGSEYKNLIEIIIQSCPNF